MNFIATLSPVMVCRATETEEHVSLSSSLRALPRAVLTLDLAKRAMSQRGDDLVVPGEPREVSWGAYTGLGAGTDPMMTPGLSLRAVEELPGVGSGALCTSFVVGIVRVERTETATTAAVRPLLPPTTSSPPAPHETTPATTAPYTALLSI